jgi:tRNA G26 N,N-dimethylase Trm1
MLDDHRKEATQGRSMMELNEQEIALLKVLADEWETSGPPGFLETTAIARALKITVPNAKSIIHSLFVKGVVGTDQVDIYAAYLTPEGYEIGREK